MGCGDGMDVDGSFGRAADVCLTRGGGFGCVGMVCVGRCLQLYGWGHLDREVEGQCVERGVAWPLWHDGFRHILLGHRACISGPRA
jgi:hypothetical protein